MFLWLHTHLNTLQVLHTFEYTRKPLCTVIFFGSVIQRNAEDHESDDLLSDRWDQWSGESLSRVDSMDHWSGNGFAWKERDRSVILIQILSMECTLSLYTDVLFLFSFFSKHQRARKKNKNICRHLWEKRGLLSPSPMSTPYHYHLHVTN